jgi:hypothetical protein
MVAAFVIHVPLLVLPLLQPAPTRDCLLEVLTPQAIEERALSEFNVAVEHYVKLHRRLARSLPMPPAFDDEDPFAADDLRAVIVAARPNARSGAFFTPQVAMRLKERIDLAFLHHPGAADAVIRGGYEPVPGEPGPVVNQPFPRVAASVRWLPLASALPALPRELDFALWGRDLVLLDVTANLVLDVLPDALPPAARPGIVYQ